MPRHPLKLSYRVLKLSLCAYLRKVKSVGEQRGFRELLVIISLQLSGNAMMQSLAADHLGLLRYTGTASISVTCS